MRTSGVPPASVPTANCGVPWTVCTTPGGVTGGTTGGVRGGVTGGTIGGVTGRTTAGRSYLTAGMTGLRAAELASLTPSSFDLNAGTPCVTLEAAYSKRKCRDTVPLHPALVAALRPFLAGKPAGVRVWPGKWAAYTEAVEFVKRDLSAARAGWLAEAAEPAERSRRESSDFLSYANAKGEKADFHSLRHMFVTGLVNGRGHAKGRQGVGPALDDHADDGPLRSRHFGGERRGRRETNSPRRGRAPSTTGRTNPRPRGTIRDDA